MIDTTAPPQRYTVLALDRDRPRAARLAAGSQPLEPSQTIDQRSRSVDDLARVLTELSSVISRLEAVAARHRDELDLQPRLHNAISQLESIGHDLLTEGDTGGANPSADEGHVEAFLTWLSFHTGTDEGEGPISPPSDGSFDRFLAGLETSPRVLPTEAAAKLGMPSGTTIGEAATALRTSPRDR
jgi:hypothetical protein